MLRKLFPVLIILSVSSCGGEEDEKPKIEGCTNELSINFNEEANHDDGSCVFPTDKIIGNWTVNEQIIFFNSTTLTSSTISDIDYHAVITAVNETEIAIATDRAAPPAHIYTGNLTVDWLAGNVEGPGSVSGMIDGDDHFYVGYTYGTTGGAYIVEVLYYRD